MRMIRWFSVILLAAPTLVRAADAPTPHPAPGMTLPDARPMDRDALIAIDKSMLGPNLAGQTSDAIFSAQQSIEKYFAGDAADRKAAAKDLALDSIDPNVLSKLCHVRMNWPALSTGVYFVDVQRTGHRVHYYLGIPPTYDRGKRWPMVVKLMSATELGKPKDPDAVLAASHDWVVAELKRHPDALVLTPIYNPNEGFGLSYAGTNSVMEPIWNAAEAVNIDPARVYLVGQSEAAAAAWNLALCYSNYFAAFDSFAGWATVDWERARLLDLTHVLPVVWADDTDKVVPMSQSTNLISLLRSKQIPVEFVKTHGQGHVPDQQTIDRCYQIMRSHVRPTYPETVALRSTRPDTLMNRADWLQTWQPMDAGAYHRLFFHGGPESMRVFDNALAAMATCKANTIDAQVNNVESLTFFLNDQMIDFSKPLVITVNRKQRFSGIVTPSVQRMLADQKLFGRGWRDFSAAIDIDLLPAPATNPATQQAK